MMPAAVIGGTLRRMRNTGIGALGLVGSAFRVQAETVREARIMATSALQSPAIPKIAPKIPRASGASMGSSTARGSSSRNDGTVNAAVITAAVTSGNMRNAKRRVERRWTE